MQLCVVQLKLCSVVHVQPNIVVRQKTRARGKHFWGLPVKSQPNNNTEIFVLVFSALLVFLKHTFLPPCAWDYLYMQSLFREFEEKRNVKQWNGTHTQTHKHTQIHINQLCRWTLSSINSLCSINTSLPVFLCAARGQLGLINSTLAVWYHPRGGSWVE